jgi:hypothetical protein
LFVLGAHRFVSVVVEGQCVSGKREKKKYYFSGFVYLVQATVTADAFGLGF